MRKRTKALAIPRAVKAAVGERDSVEGRPCCVACGAPAPAENPLAYSNAHYVPRTQGGLGIEENVVTLCPGCHRLYDQSTHRGMYRKIICDYLRARYDNWKESKLTYQKWEE